jgi:hypothetical protein
MAKLRADFAAVAYWHIHPRQARNLTGGGLKYLAGGPNAAQLHLKYGQAAGQRLRGVLVPTCKPQPATGQLGQR